MQSKRSVCLVLLRKDVVMRRYQIHKGYATRLTPRLTQKSTVQPLAFRLHGSSLGKLAFWPPNPHFFQWNEAIFTTF